MSKDKHTKVKIDGKEYVAFIDAKTGKPGIVPMGMGFDSGISCPPIPPGACPTNYDASCLNGSVWCEFHEGEG